MRRITKASIFEAKPAAFSSCFSLEVSHHCDYFILNFRQKREAFGELGEHPVLILKQIESTKDQNLLPIVTKGILTAPVLAVHRVLDS